MPKLELLKITVEPLEDARLVRVAGDVDRSSVETLRRELDAARDDGETTLLDLADVTFMDTSGLHLLVDASRSAAADGWAFFIVRPSRAVGRLIELSRTTDELALVQDSSVVAA
jgi:anti-sigma B factor antagonist